MSRPVGLRRFARPAPAQSPGVGASAGVAGQRTAEERCEMCGVALGPRHGHVVDAGKRTLACACRACFLLFTTPGAGHGRYLAVPERVHHDPAHPLAPADWAALRVPVGTAFFFRNSALDRVVGCYPSPGGATECELDLAAWDQIAERYPLLRVPAPDLEAIFVHRTDETMETFLVPIDLCYALVGSVRLHWRGLDGGDEVRTALADFVSDLRERSTPLPEK